MDRAGLRGPSELLHQEDVRRAGRLPVRPPDDGPRRANEDRPVAVARRPDLHGPRASPRDHRESSRNWRRTTSSRSGSTSTRSTRTSSRRWNEWQTPSPGTTRDSGFIRDRGKEPRSRRIDEADDEFRRPGVISLAAGGARCNHAGLDPHPRGLRKGSMRRAYAVVVGVMIGIGLATAAGRSPGPAARQPVCRRRHRVRGDAVRIEVRHLSRHAGRRDRRRQPAQRHVPKRRHRSGSRALHQSRLAGRHAARSRSTAPRWPASSRTCAT